MSQIVDRGQEPREGWGTEYAIDQMLGVVPESERLRMYEWLQELVLDPGDPPAAVMGAVTAWARGELDEFESAVREMAQRAMLARLARDTIRRMVQFAPSGSPVRPADVEDASRD